MMMKMIFPVNHLPPLFSTHQLQIATATGDRDLDRFLRLVNVVSGRLALTQTTMDLHPPIRRPHQDGTPRR